MNIYKVDAGQNRIDKVLKLTRKFNRIYVHDELPKELKQAYKNLNLAIMEAIRQEAKYLGATADDMSPSPGDCDNYK